MIVADASLVVAALTDAGPIGSWAGELVEHTPVAAPHLLKAEVANILRRAVHHDELSADVAAMAHGDLVDLAVESMPYEPFGFRVWGVA